MAVVRDVLEAIHQRRGGANSGSDLFSVVDSHALTDAEKSAGVTPANFSFGTTPYDIRRYGASKAASNATNKAALQAAISVVSAEGSTSGGVIIVPPNINYGYHIFTQNTFPDFTNCVTPCVVIDYGPGSSFSGFPTAYDGTQIRYFYFTPDTSAPAIFTASVSGGATSATLTSNWLLTTGPWKTTFSNGDIRYVTYTLGATTATWTGGLTSAASASANYTNTAQHEGNTEFLRGAWNPGYFVVNDSFLPTPGSPTRTALDNRRCQMSFGNDGLEWWKIGQGTAIGPNVTDEDLSNFALQKITAPGDTIGNFVPFVFQRKTGNASFGSGNNAPAASYHFYSVSTGFDQAMFENVWDVNSRIVLRTVAGSTTDAYWGNNSTTGAQSLGFRATGDALLIDRASRRVTVATCLAQAIVPVSYSASVSYSAGDGNFFTLTVTNGSAFTINAPTNAVTGLFHTLTIRNTSGGALGVATFNAVFKLAAWTQPANGNSRSITFRFDNTNWVEISRTPADVPN